MPIFSFAVGYFLARNHEIGYRSVQLINGISAITGAFSMLLVIFSGCFYYLIVGISVVSFFSAFIYQRKEKFAVYNARLPFGFFMCGVLIALLLYAIFNPTADVLTRAWLLGMLVIAVILLYFLWKASR